MDPTTAAAALSLTLFPTSDFREVGVGPYGFETTEAPSIVDGLPAGTPAGLELMTRRVFDTESSLMEDSKTPTGQGMNLRMYRDAQGQIVLDRFELESVPMNIRVRPELGDTLDIGLFSGTWNEVWKFGDTGRVNWRVWSPLSLTLLGILSGVKDTYSAMQKAFQPIFDAVSKWNAEHVYVDVPWAPRLPADAKYELSGDAQLPTLRK